MYYQYVYPETQFLVVPCIVDGISKESWRDTESGVDAVIGEMTRLIKQFSFMLEEDSRHNPPGGCSAVFLEGRRKKKITGQTSGSVML